jgi:uncharacterized protein
MPHRDSAPLGSPCWVELFTSAPDKTVPFYRELFGWTVEEMGDEYGGYINFHKNGERIAGCMRNDGTSGTPDLWSIYLATDDAEKVAAATTAHGGQVVVPPVPVMQLGTMAVLSDPGGASIGAWQPGLHPGFTTLGEPSTPSWFELHTRKYDDSIRFYRDVFKWDTHVAGDTPAFRYTTLGEGDGRLAGIMDVTGFAPDDTPAKWSIYFGVENTDRSLEQIVAHGGSVLIAPDDSAFGRLAHAADPTGAEFKLVGQT